MNRNVLWNNQCLRYKCVMLKFPNPMDGSLIMQLFRKIEDDGKNYGSATMLNILCELRNNRKFFIKDFSRNFPFEVLSGFFPEISLGIPSSQNSYCVPSFEISFVLSIIRRIFRIPIKIFGGSIKNFIQCCSLLLLEYISEFVSELRP